MKNILLYQSIFLILVLILPIKTFAQQQSFVKMANEGFYLDSSVYYPVGVNYGVNIVWDSVPDIYYVAPHHSYQSNNRYPCDD